MPLLKFKPVDRARENNGLLGGEKFKYPAKRNSVKMLELWWRRAFKKKLLRAPW